MKKMTFECSFIAQNPFQTILEHRKTLKHFQKFFNFLYVSNPILHRWKKVKSTKNHFWVLFHSLRPYRKIFSSIENEFLALSKWGTALGCLNTSTPATVSCHMTGGRGSRQTPCKEFYNRKTDFLSVKSSFLFKFHQSTYHKKSLSDWWNLNKRLDFTERNSVFRW